MNGLAAAAKSNCQCDLQARRAQNCCCFPSSDQQHSACCSLPESPKPEPSEEDTLPQFNSYCGLPATNGILLDRQPRLSEANEDVLAELNTLERIQLQDETAIEHQLSIELPPPEFAAS